MDARRGGEHFHEVLGQHLQPVGMPAHALLGNKK